MYRELGQPRAAGTLIARMLARLPDVPALRVEAGRNALAVEDYASAVGHLEAALVLDPEAGEVHYPLAMAYRGLGDRERAGRLLRRWRTDGPGAPVRLPDPLMAALNGVLRNPQYYRDLASRAASRDRGEQSVRAEMVTRRAFFELRRCLRGRYYQHPRVGRARV